MTHVKTTAYIRDETDAEYIGAMVVAGIPQQTIADVIGIDAKTLRKYYRPELDQGMAARNGKVVQTMFMKATGGGDWSRADTGAAIFWCKANLGWKETTVVESPADRDDDADKAILDQYTRQQHGAPAKDPTERRH